MMQLDVCSATRKLLYISGGRRMTSFIILFVTILSYLLNRLAALYLRRVTKATGVSRFSGDEIALMVLKANKIENVKVKPMEKAGEDQYNPLLKIIQLGPDVYGCKTIYSVAAGSHEACHAVDFQYLRFLYIPLSMLTKFVFLPLFLLAFFIQSFLLHVVVWLIYLSLFLFKFIVEVLDEVHINRLAIKTLIQFNLVEPEDLLETKKVFRSFNLTYLTSLPLKIFIYN
jgi:uncharacterized protein